MKKIPGLAAIILSLFINYSAGAQENGSFTFQILDYKGAAISQARLIVLSGENHMASIEG